MRFITILIMVGLGFPGLAQSAKTSNPDSLQVVVEDVANFWSAYDQLATAHSHADSLQIIDREYLTKGSKGLKLYQRLSYSDAGSFLSAIRTHPRLLQSIRSNTLAIHTHKRRLIDGACKLKQIYPASLFPELFFCVGKFEVAGNRTDDILYIGTELTCLAKDSPRDELTNAYVRAAAGNFDRLDAVCLHEVAHFQQVLVPKTNLEAALVEGGAEFVAHWLTGMSTMQTVFDQVNTTLEKTVWNEFLPQMDKPIEARWFLATGDEKEKRPGMLGYLIGFRICERYYQRSTDKRKALSDIITLSKPQAILEESGYRIAMGKQP